MSTPPSRVWRWLVLVAVVANVAFNNLYALLGLGGVTIAQVTDRYPTLFRPAGFTFSIWGVIYAAFLAYAVAQLLPRNRENALPDRLAPLVIAANALTSAWIVAFTADHIGLSFAVMLSTLACAVALFVRAHAGVSHDRHSRAWLVPFSLFLGWISVATIANASILLVSMGLRAAALPWAVALVAVAAALATTLALRFRDLLIPAVVGWACFGIFAFAHGRHEVLGGVALVAGVLMAACAFGVAAWGQARPLAAPSP